LREKKVDEFLQFFPPKITKMSTPQRNTAPASDANLGTPSGPSTLPKKNMLMSTSYDFNAATGEGLFIGISGLIGAGKTTLATALAKELNLPVYYEPVVDNVYLEDFYGDMAKYSFPMQIYLLNKRYKQQQQIIWNNTGGVQDRTIYEDSVFASMLYQSGQMEERDYATYRELFSSMSNFMRRPNLIVHLDLTPQESMRRINERNRGCESGISIEYLTALYNACKLCASLYFVAVIYLCSLLCLLSLFPDNFVHYWFISPTCSCCHFHFHRRNVYLRNFTHYSCDKSGLQSIQNRERNGRRHCPRIFPTVDGASRILDQQKSGSSIGRRSKRNH
jgi:deoxyadenosine/deoxycytidine kinase